MRARLALRGGQKNVEDRGGQKNVEDRGGQKNVEDRGGQKNVEKHSGACECSSRDCTLNPVYSRISGLSRLPENFAELFFRWVGGAIKGGAIRRGGKGGASGYNDGW